MIFQPIIEVHSHPLIPAFRKALAGEAIEMPLPPWSIEEHLEVMDQHGIGVCVLSVNSVADAMAGPRGRSVARELNDGLAEIVSRHPSRFGALAAIPMDDMNAALDEMDYALDVLKLDGLSASTHFRGTYLGEPNYDPWFEEMNRRSATLYVHPVAPPEFDGKTSKMNVSVIDFMFDTTRMVTNMVLSGTKQRFNKINIISTHAGGTIPFLAHRISLVSQMPWAYRGGPKMTGQETMAALGSFYYDLTASTSATSLDALRSLVPAERLLLGFDYPLMPAQTIAPAIRLFSGYSGFNEAEKRKIISENAVGLFPRLRKQ